MTRHVHCAAEWIPATSWMRRPQMPQTPQMSHVLGHPAIFWRGISFLVWVLHLGQNTKHYSFIHHGFSRSGVDSAKFSNLQEASSSRTSFPQRFADRALSHLIAQRLMPSNLKSGWSTQLSPFFACLSQNFGEL